MPWYEKHQPTPLEDQPINGLAFLHGDVAARQYRQEWVSGKKYPVVTFPSGVSRELIPMQQTANMSVFSDVAFPYPVTRDEAYRLLTNEKNAAAYHVVDFGREGFIVRNRATRRGYGFGFDKSSGELVNLTPIPAEAMELLPSEIQAVLPHLYATEKLDGKAIAPVKFFTPDAHWTWYATEGSPVDADGYYDTDKPKVDYIFFGLVDGDELEVGYFSLSELESVRGVFGLPIERDLSYTPESLDVLQEKHRRQRGR